MGYEPMTDAEVAEFLRAPVRPGLLATVRADGRPHAVPIWYDVDHDGTLVFNTGEDRRLRIAWANPGPPARHPPTRSRSPGVDAGGSWLVETMGIEPTTPCLQSKISRFRDQAWIGEDPGQTAFSLTATPAEQPRSPIEKGT